MSALVVGVDPKVYGVDAQRLERVTSFFDGYVERRQLPGWFATVARGGELVWKGSGGWRDREQELPVTDDTIWRIFSMTKPITSVAAMILYEEGHFDLNDPVSKWIPAFKTTRVFRGGTSQSPVTEGLTEPIRVHHLLSHTSGLTYGFQYVHPVDAIYRAKGYDFGYAKGADLARAVDDWASAPLLFQPGSHWNYSVSVDVLGRLIEIWSGQRLDVFIKERVSDPLGMTDTRWWCTPENEDRLAMLYALGPDGIYPLSDLASAARRERPIFDGGGGLLSTAHDYHRFTAMLLGGGALEGVRILSSKTVDLMTRNHLPDNVDLEHFATGAFAETDMAGVGFGLGFSVVIDQAANKSLFSEGTFAWGGAASTVFWVDPVEDLAVCFYTQLLPSSTFPLRRQLQRLVYSALVD
ncbi:MAG TPA: serine hydrolase domain-containing protein [Acidimicrobiales bacterium]|jgi:CubicO group peptidase (beta-lactamase class C family)